MSWIKEFGRRFKFTGTNEPKSAPPAQANAKRVVNPNPTAKSNKKKGGHGEKTNYRAHFEGLVDVVENEGKSAFLVKNGTELEFLNKVELDGETLFPPPLDKLPFPLIPGADIIGEYKSISTLAGTRDGFRLYDSIKKYLYDISYLPSEEYYDLCASWVLHTYRIEATDFSPILWFYAIPERGKTRTGKGMIYASFRGMHVESLNSAYILRAASDLRASLFIDVFELWKKAARADTIDILLHRFERGAIVPRVLWADRGPFKDTAYFSVFGPSIIGTNRTINPTLESRSIQIIMPESNRQFENNVTLESAHSLRVLLEAYRACFLGHPLPDIIKPFTSRYGDLTKPLLQVVREIAPKCEVELLKVLKELEEQRLFVKSESFEAMVLAAIVNKASEVKNGYLPFKVIQEEINHERNENSKLTPQKIGKVISSMGLNTERRTRTGGASLFWEVDKLNHLLKKHGLEKMSETSESSEHSLSKTEVSEDSEGLDLPLQ